jgi:hypothetical protein
MAKKPKTDDPLDLAALSERIDKLERAFLALEALIERQEQRLAELERVRDEYLF